MYIFLITSAVLIVVITINLIILHKKSQLTSRKIFTKGLTVLLLIIFSILIQLKSIGTEKTIMLPKKMSEKEATTLVQKVSSEAYISNSVKKVNADKSTFKKGLSIRLKLKKNSKEKFIIIRFYGPYIWFWKTKSIEKLFEVYTSQVRKTVYEKK